MSTTRPLWQCIVLSSVLSRRSSSPWNSPASNAGCPLNLTGVHPSYPSRHRPAENVSNNVGTTQFLTEPHRNAQTVLRTGLVRAQGSSIMKSVGFVRLSHVAQLSSEGGLRTVPLAGDRNWFDAARGSRSAGFPAIVVLVMAGLTVGGYFLGYQKGYVNASLTAGEQMDRMTHNYSQTVQHLQARLPMVHARDPLGKEVSSTLDVLPRWNAPAQSQGMGSPEESNQPTSG